MAPKNVRSKLVYSLDDFFVDKDSRRISGFPFSNIPKCDIDTEVLDRFIVETFILNEKKFLLLNSVCMHIININIITLSFMKSLNNLKMLHLLPVHRVFHEIKIFTILFFI